MLNILVIGKRKAGKSSLIDAFLGDNVTEGNKGIVIYNGIKKYSKENSPYSLYEAKLDNNYYNIRKIISDRNNAPDVGQHFHVMWICISQNQYYRQNEYDFIKVFSKIINRVIIVITNSWLEDRGLQSKLKRDFPEFNVIRINSKSFNLNNGIIVEPFNLNELKKITKNIQLNHNTPCKTNTKTTNEKVLSIPKPLLKSTSLSDIKIKNSTESYSLKLPSLQRRSFSSLNIPLDEDINLLITKSSQNLNSKTLSTNRHKRVYSNVENIKPYSNIERIRSYSGSVAQNSTNSNKNIIYLSPQIKNENDQIKKNKNQLKITLPNNEQYIKLEENNKKNDYLNKIKENEKELEMESNNSLSFTIDESNKLHMACINGDVEKLNDLIDKGVDLSEKTKDGWSALHIAVCNNKINIVKCLLDHGVNKNVVNDGYSPLYLASQNGFNDIVKLLMETNSGDHSITNEWSAIKIACSNGHYQIVEYMISKNVDIHHKKNDDEYSLLHIATEEKKLDMINLLLTIGHINVNEKDLGGWTALHIAARENLLDIANFLIKEANAEVNEYDKNNNTPLHIASQYGNYDVVQSLINNKAIIDYKNHDGWTPLHTACQNERINVVNYLLQYGAKVDVKANDGKTPLHIACENDNKEIVQLLIEKHANIDMGTYNNWTALHFAIYYKNPNIVKYLLGKNPCMNIKNNEGLTALEMANRLKNNTISRILINHMNHMMKNKNMNNVKRNNYFFYTKVNDATSKIINESETLINEIKNNNTREAYNIIASHKISFEYIDKNGWSALHWTAYMGNSEIAKELIKNNVELKRKTKFGLGDSNEFKGKTAKEIAEKRGNTEIVKLIKKRTYTKAANIAINVVTNMSGNITSLLN
eukprot:jgi/Orpsp1_1/1181853/evm.model.c7180000078879.3